MECGVLYVRRCEQPGGQESVFESHSYPPDCSLWLFFETKRGP